MRATVIGNVRSALRRFERAILGLLMRAGAKIADRRVAKEVDQRRDKDGR